jgi:hypothetical protein
VPPTSRLHGNWPATRWTCTQSEPVLASVSARIGAGGGKGIPSLVGLENVERATLRLLQVMGNDLRSLPSLRSLELGPEGGVLEPGELSIRYCPDLTSLAGLERLTLGASDVDIENNPRLETLSPLVFPPSVEAVYLYENPVLRDIGALSAVEQVGGFNLRGNAVETLSATLAPRRAGGVEVSNIPMLVDASGLENLESVGEMRIVGNPVLRRTPDPQLRRSARGLRL